MENSNTIARTVVLSSGLTLVLLLSVALATKPWWLPALSQQVVPEQQRVTEQLIESRVITSAEIIPDVVEQANPAVVSVVVTRDVPIYERYYEEVNPWGFWGGGISVPRIREQGTEEREVGGGSGFFVSPDGLIVTNRHVVSDQSARYSVLLNDGRSFPVNVLARDQVLDIAILQVEPENGETFPHLRFADSRELRLGESVIAIGNALAEFRNSVSVGVVSGLARSITASDGRGRSEQLDQVIQTDAAINPGNSGGPLLNLAGLVVGVNVATTRGAENISFALPAHIVRTVVDSVIEHGEIVRPFLGVRYAMITPAMQTMNNMSVDYGALVVRGRTTEELAVMPGSPADRAGLRENDIILEIDGQPLRNTDLATVLRQKQVGDTIELRVLQQGEERTLSVTLVQSP